MKHDSRVFRHETIVAAAAIAAHATDRGEGFRLRDVTFLLDLFLNWIDTSLQGDQLRMHATQVQRYLLFLAREGLAKKFQRARTPTFRLTRVGLIELLRRIVREERLGREQFFFVHYFVRTYAPLVFSLIQREGAQFPTAMRIEVEELLDLRSLVTRQLAAAERELRRIDVRIQDAQSSVALFRKRRAEGASLRECVMEVEKLYPYELNTQKPLHELVSMIPDEHQERELTESNKQRIELIWQPIRSLHLQYLEQLKRL